MVLVHRSDHAMPLRKALLAAEDEEAEADERIGHGAEADDGDEEEEGLEEPFLGEFEVGLHEDHEEDGVAGVTEAEGVMVVESEEDEADAEDEPPEDEEGPAELPEEDAGVAPEHVETEQEFEVSFHGWRAVRG
jgi:hypothetical protein